MDKVVISILGRDRPGIVGAVSRILLDRGCNIEDVTQTSLQAEFAGIFIASMPDNLAPSTLLAALKAGLAPFGVDVLVKRLERRPAHSSPSSAEPFVITTMGPDRMGLVAGVTEVMARFGVNITNMKAVFRGGTDPFRNIMIYEVDVDRQIDHAAFRTALRERAQELDLDITIQHRRIFEAINRV
ncbi:MAG: amino acid-binding protein [Deltaproteobacteria bacterium HGW-Deltaproteobacteria-15]|jgi:glycine cleavage system transcriptional repressor|nr:MAG: amino acid-binding protein [Deltaproteobacteria bacterium HGW-Deltaproteobacteria-15]